MNKEITQSLMDKFKEYGYFSDFEADFITNKINASVLK